MPELQSSSPPDPTLEDRRLSRRVWSFAFALLLILIGAALSIILFYDGPAPDDHLMIPAWSDRGRLHNPLGKFCAELHRTPVQTYGDLPLAVRNGAPGHEAAIQEFVTRQTSANAAFANLLSSDLSTWQWPGMHSTASYVQKAHEVDDILMLLQVLRLKMTLLNHEGHAQEAVRLALRIQVFGEGLAHSEGDGSRLQAAAIIQLVGFTQLEKSITAASLSPDILTECLDQLNRLQGIRLQDYIFSVQADYVTFKNDLADVKKSGLIGSVGGSGLQKKWQRKMIKPNQTLHELLKLELPSFHAAPQGWIAAASAMTANEKSQARLADEEQQWQFFLDPNCGGKTLALLYWVNRPRLLKFVMEVQARHQITRTMLALRLFELKYHHLPDQIGDLSPEFLPATPQDPFDNKDLRWSKDRGIVYSIGTDQIDHGGDVVSLKPNKHTDLGQFYWWSEEAQKVRDDEQQALMKKYGAPSPKPAQRLNQGEARLNQ